MAPDMAKDPSIVIVEYMTDSSSLHTEDAVTTNKGITQEKRHGNINRNHTESRPFICKTCNKTFGSLKNLKLHEKKHDKANPYTCYECNKAFACRRNYESHKKTFTGIHFSCDICGRSFRYKAEIESHIQGIHNTSFSTQKKDGQKNIIFSCDECKKTFVSSVSLNIHKRNHELEKAMRIDSNPMQNYMKVLKKRVIKSEVGAILPENYDSKNSLQSTPSLKRNHLEETKAATLEDNDECGVDDPMPMAEKREHTDLNNEKEETVYLPVSVNTNALKEANTVDLNSISKVFPSENDSASSLLTNVSLEKVHYVPISEQFNVQSNHHVPTPEHPINKSVLPPNVIPENNTFHTVSAHKQPKIKKTKLFCSQLNQNEPKIVQLSHTLNPLNPEQSVYYVQQPIVEHEHVPQLNQQGSYVTIQENQNPTTVNFTRNHSINQDSCSSILKTMGTEEMLNVFDNSLVNIDHDIVVTDSDITNNDSEAIIIRRQDLTVNINSSNINDNGAKDTHKTLIGNSQLYNNIEIIPQQVTVINLENNESISIDLKNTSSALKDTVKFANNSNNEQYKKSTKISDGKSLKSDVSLTDDDDDLNFIIIREVKPNKNKDLGLSDESWSEEESESNLFAYSDEHRVRPAEKRLNIMEYSVVEPQPNLSFDSMPMFETENDPNY